MTTTDPILDRLTDEQLVAAASARTRLFIEAEPGSGKTTVAAQRYGAQRFRQRFDAVQPDRAAVAVSFTHSATYELQQRVRRTWGPIALRWPHRIVTIDSLLYELLEYLLQAEEIRWPNGHMRLQVEDTWRAIAAPEWTAAVAAVTLAGRQVIVVGGRTAKAASRTSPAVFYRSVHRGICTHEEVRAILTAALRVQAISVLVMDRLRATVRALIVDEVFDANPLDLHVVELALGAGVDVTIIGDPWQALYGFRGATPEAVPGLVARTAMDQLPLSASFRWRTDAQANLANALRGGSSIALPSGDAESDVDVVLASEWQSLWEAGDGVLPFAYGSAKGSPPEAAATLLLNQLTRTIFGEDATYAADALTTLGISDLTVLDRLEGPLREVLETLRHTGKFALNAAYEQLAAAIRIESEREIKKAHPAYTKRLDVLRSRLARERRLVPGLTIHQAKGREWDYVGVRLTDHQIATLGAGLRSDDESHRQLYVACTRARYRTLAV